MIRMAMTVSFKNCFDIYVKRRLLRRLQKAVTPFGGRLSYSLAVDVLKENAEVCMMKKSTTKVYAKAKKAGKAFMTSSRDALTGAMERYPLRAEEEIEKILSPFWAWRSLNG